MIPTFSAPARVALCAVLLACVGGAVSVQAKDDAPTRLLTAELPKGKTLETATCDEAVYATRRAVRKNPAMAQALMESAINGRPHSGRGYDGKDGKDGVGAADCACLTRIVQAAVESAPANRIHELVESAMAAHPQCGNEIADLLKNSSQYAANNTDGTNFGDGLIGDPGSGIGGYGPGFPGGSGLVGSPPSGGTAFPPVGTNPVTSTVNQ